MTFQRSNTPPARTPPQKRERDEAEPLQIARLSLRLCIAITCAYVETLLLNPTVRRNMSSLKLSDLLGVHQRSAHFVDAIKKIVAHDFIDIE
ncbi:hypothetical protein R69776_04599 [Paraburkholderia nemoris]|uniref:Uncharacterized protein n=1 Tax=Paraburkholderia nemoris TaxID=2793076 RepID=A0ABM8S3Q6_9BURK|nr:hypothetical protein R69776_04599 [Paraburkholderia nemoris]